MPRQAALNRVAIGGYSVKCRGTAGDFNNSQDYFTVNGFNFNPSVSEFTLLSWYRGIRLGNDSGMYNMALFGQNDGDFANGGKGYLVSNVVGGQFSSALSGNWLTGIIPIRNVWKPLALMKRGTQLLFYYDFSLRAILNSPVIPNMNGTFRIGSGKNDPALGHGTRCADGNFGETLFYSRSMTDAEILQWMQNGQHNRTNLVFEFLMRTNNNGLAPLDTGPNAYTTTWNGNATWDDTLLPAPPRNLAVARNAAVGRTNAI